MACLLSAGVVLGSLALPHPARDAANCTLTQESAEMRVFAPVPKVKVLKKKPRSADFLELVNGSVSVSSELTFNDPLDPSLKNPGKTYTVEMKSGKRYRIDHMSKAFDAYLRLSNPAGTEVKRDDDSGGNLNSRIIYDCPADGEYKIHATSLNRRVGPYVLEVREE